MKQAVIILSLILFAQANLKGYNPAEAVGELADATSDLLDFLTCGIEGLQCTSEASECLNTLNQSELEVDELFGSSLKCLMLDLSECQNIENYFEKFEAQIAKIKSSCDVPEIIGKITGLLNSSAFYSLMGKIKNNEQEFILKYTDFKKAIDTRNACEAGKIVGETYSLAFDVCLA